jgi:HSP20 family protein
MVENAWFPNYTGGDVVSLIRWNPYGEMLSLRQAMDRLLEESFVQPRGMSGEMEHAGMDVDVMERNDAYVIRASMPGVKPEDINVTIERGVLTIRGELRHEEEKEGGRYYRRERRYGAYARSISLPAEVNADACDANYEHGVLTITMPKAEQARARQIPLRGQATHSTTPPVIEGEKVGGSNTPTKRT